MSLGVCGFYLALIIAKIIALLVYHISIALLKIVETQPAPVQQETAEVRNICQVQRKWMRDQVSCRQRTNSRTGMTSSQSSATGHCNNSSFPKNCSSNSQSRASQTEDLFTERPLSRGLLVNQSSQTDLSALDPSCSLTDSLENGSDTVPSRHAHENATGIVASGDRGPSSTQREVADTDGNIVRQDGSTEMQPNTSTSREDAVESSEMLDRPECRQEDELNDPSTDVDRGSEDQATSLERCSLGPQTTTVQENLACAGNNGAVDSDSLLSSGSTCIDEREGSESAQHLNHAPPTDCGGETHTGVDNRAESGEHGDDRAAHAAAQLACDEVSVAQDHVASDREVASTEGRPSTAGIASHTAHTAAEHFTVNEGAALGSLPLTAEGSTRDPPRPQRSPLRQNSRPSPHSTNTISTGARRENRPANTTLTTACRGSCPPPYSANTTSTGLRQDHHPPPYSTNTISTRACQDNLPPPYSANATTTRHRQDNRPPSYLANTISTRAAARRSHLMQLSPVTVVAAQAENGAESPQQVPPVFFIAPPPPCDFVPYHNVPTLTDAASVVVYRNISRHLNEGCPRPVTFRSTPVHPFRFVPPLPPPRAMCPPRPPAYTVHPPSYSQIHREPPPAYCLHDPLYDEQMTEDSQESERMSLLQRLLEDNLPPVLEVDNLPPVLEVDNLPPVLEVGVFQQSCEMAMSQRPYDTDVSQQRAGTTASGHSQEAVVSRRSRAIEVSQQSPDTEMSQLSLGAAILQHTLERDNSRQSQQAEISQSQATGLSHLQESEISQQLLEARISQQSRETEISQQSQEADVSQQSQNTGFAQQSNDAGITLQSQDTGNAQRSQDTCIAQQSQAAGNAQRSQESGFARQSRNTGTAQQSQDTGTAQQSRDTGSAQQSQDTGSAQQSQDTGTAQQSRDTGSAQQSQDTGSAQQPQDTGSAQQSQDSAFAQQSQDTGTAEQSQGTGFAQQSQDSGFAQRSLSVMQPVEFFIPVPVDLQRPPPQLTRPPLQQEQEFFHRGCGAAGTFAPPRRAHSRHEQYWHERPPYHEFTYAEHHRHSTFAQRQGSASGCPPRLPRQRLGFPSQPQPRDSTLPVHMSRYPPRGRGNPEQFQVHRVRRVTIGRNRHYGTSRSQTSDDSDSDVRPWSA